MLSPTASFSVVTSRSYSSVRREPALRDERVFGCRELQRRFGLLDLDGQFLLDAQEECGFLSLDLVELRVDLVDT